MSLMERIGGGLKSVRAHTPCFLSGPMSLAGHWPHARELSHRLLTSPVAFAPFSLLVQACLFAAGGLRPTISVWS